MLNDLDEIEIKMANQTTGPMMDVWILQIEHLNSFVK